MPALNRRQLHIPPNVVCNCTSKLHKIMYQGEPTKGIEFFNLLEKSEEFTSELGKVALTSGKLEAELIIFLEQHDVKGNYKRATLGSLIEKIEKQGLLDKNMIHALKMITTQRNYITHNIYALFIDQLDETILEKYNLLDSDVHLYIERAWQLNENINGLTDIIKRKK
jgi:hypothetical protein